MPRCWAEGSPGGSSLPKPPFVTRRINVDASLAAQGLCICPVAPPLVGGAPWSCATHKGWRYLCDGDERQNRQPLNRWAITLCRGKNGVRLRADTETEAGRKRQTYRACVSIFRFRCSTWPHERGHATWRRQCHTAEQVFGRVQRL